MTTNDLMNAVLAHADVDPATPVGDAELRRLLEAVIGPPREADFRYFSDSLAASLPDLEGRTGFDYRVKGGWVVDLSSTAVRAVVSGALVATALAGVGESAAVLAAETFVVVLPLLVDVRRIRLAESEAVVHLALHEEFRQQVEGHLSADELFALLPEEVREQVSPLDFVDMLDRFKAAGLTTEDANGRLAILPRNDARLRIRFE